MFISFGFDKRLSRAREVCSFVLLFMYRKTICQRTVLLCFSSICIVIILLGILLKEQQIQSEAMVEILDAAKLYRHTQEYEARRSQMEAQLRSIRTDTKNVSPIQQKSKFILLDDVVLNAPVKYKMVVMVFSHSLNFVRRALIRHLWGNSTMWKTTERYRVIFLLGGIFDESKLRKIYHEAKLHQDIILESVPEGYYTTSSKLGICLHWLAQHTALDYKFVLKSDDDVFVHIDNVMKTVNSKKYQDAHFFGRLTENPRPLRDGRYKITKIEYPQNNFPPFHSGAGVFMSKFLLERIAPYFDFINPLKLEDVYLAWLVQEYGGGIKPINCNGYDLYNTKCSYNGELLFTHPVKTEPCMRKLVQAAVRGMD